jgi:phospholipid-translocating P-type ATPase (flippase)
MNSPRTERFHREINVKGDESASSSHFSRNILHLSKYYWPVIVPHILFEQFFRVSNIWFLITSIFQIAIDDDSPVGRYTTVAPLIFMLLVAIIKSSYADFKLKKQDQKINSSKYQVWNGEEFKEKRCDDIIVGDLVMVDKDQIVPADLVILYFEGNKKNAFIDMSSLSGSSSLKEVKVIEKNTKIVNENSGTITVNLKFKGTFYITEPSSDYNNFDGKIVISGIPGSVEVNISNLAFRGSCLKCVDKSVGLAVYCGNESKIQLNGTETRKKSSQIEKRINVFIIQILIAFSLVIGISLIPYYEVYVNKNIRSSDKFNQEYFEFSSQPNPIRPIITFSLLYSYIIPISLFVSIDLARWIQSHNLKRLVPGTMILNDKINEDLGQVEYILADKTGTITEKSLSVVNLVVHDKHLSEKLRNSISYENNNLLIPESFMIEDPHKLDMFKEAIFDSSKYKKAKHFIRCMCLSNSLIKDQNQFIGSYDEQALVEVARYIGFDLLDSNSSHITMNINGKEKNFDCIIVKPFDSEVKKSRAIVINHEEKSGYFYIKGERSKLIDSLKCSRQLKININNQIFDMNNKGYRTMILAYKKLSRDVIEKTRKKLKKINQILLNSEENIEKMFKKLEDDFTFLGVSCIEEKIRPETIDTVNSIRKAGIKIWMVSGDTYSNTVLAFKKSEMIPENSEIIHIRSIKDDYQCQKILKESISEYIFKERKKKRTMSSILDFSSFRLDVGAELSEENTKKLNNQALFSKIADVQLDEINLDREFDVRHLKYVVSIDGDSLITALNNDNCRKLLLLLLVCAKSVCFSALTPIDKGKVVKLLKKNLKFKPIVMSVGRGEGNISLLRESDIGVSLFTNLENNSLLQHNSDVIISHFSQLEKLVLKHGHWFYFRICRMILLYFYKNFFLILLLLGFFFECEYSGTSLFNSSLLVGFNIFFTTSCMLHIGIYDKDLTGREIEENLQVYMIGIIGMHFNLVKFLKYMSFAAVQAAIFLFVFFYFHQEIINEDGKTDDLEMFGTVIFLSMVFTILLQTILETSTYSVAYFLSHGACVSLLIGYVFYASAYDDVSEISLLGVQKKIGNSSLPFFNIFCSSTICVAFTYVVVKFRELFNPGIIQKIKSIHEDGLFYDRIKEYSKSLSSIYRDSLSWSTSSNRHKFAMKKYSKVFKLRFVEKEFKEGFIEDQIILIRITVTLMWFLLIAWSFIQKLMSNSNGDYTKTSYILASVFSIFVLLVYTSHFKRHFTLYILAGFTISIVVKFAIEVSFKYYSILASSLVPLLAYILLNVGWFMMNFVNLFNILLTIISVIIVNSGQSHDENYKKYNSPISASLLIVFVAITMIAAIVGYFIELSKRKEFKLLNKTFTVVERTQSILSLLLPQFVKHRVNDGARFIAEAEEDVTIMFCDIYKFDEICQEIKPKDVCECLDKLFQIFDGLCENIGVTKIETVGKTYMACSGIKESEQEISHYLSAVPPARRVVELALAIIREVKNTRLPNDKKLRVKIGIHTGRVVAGVVGYHKPQFSLVGDTVNTASRMCSTLDKLNRVQISGVTYAKLSEFSEYNFEYREIEAKGKGKLPAYIVTYKNYESAMSRSQSFELPLIRELKTPQKPAKVSSVKHQLEEILNRISSKRINPITFITCKESNEKTQMPIRTLKPSKKIIKGTLLIAIVTYCLITVNIGVYLKVNEGKETNNFEYYLGVKFVVIVSFSMILYFFDRLLPTRCYPVLIAVISLASMLINFVPFMQEGTNDDMILIIANYIGIEFMFCSIILSHTSGLQFQYVFFLNSFFFIPWTYLIFTSDEKGYHISNIAITACFVVINCVAIIIREKIYLVNIFLKKRANAEIKKTKKLLSQMMPPTALSRLQNN